MPKVSVMILTKDRAHFLSRALASVASQSFKDFEIVIGDNHSTGDIKPMLDELGNRGVQIKHLYHNPEVSITENRQRVLNASAGEYVAPLDDDDIWCDRDKLKKQVEFMDTHPDVVLCGGAIRKVDDAGNPLGGEVFRPKSDIGIRRAMLLENTFFTSTVIFKRLTALKIGGFEFFENDLAEDYLFWLKMGLEGKLYNFQEVFTDYRVTVYPKEKQLGFYLKQEHLIARFKNRYPNYILGRLLIFLRWVKAKII